MDIDEEIAIITGRKPTASKETAPEHPKYKDMVIKALTVLQEKGGSSRLKILRFIVSQFNVADEARANTHLKLALKNAVSDGTLIQSSGTGAAGSFRLSDATVRAQSKGKKSEEIDGKPTKNGRSVSMKTKKQYTKNVSSKPKSDTAKGKSPAAEKRVTQKAGVKKQRESGANKSKANADEKPVSQIKKPLGTAKPLVGKKDTAGKSVKAQSKNPKASFAKTNTKKSTSKEQIAGKGSKTSSAKKAPKARETAKSKSTATTTKRITRNSLNKKN